MKILDCIRDLLNSYTTKVYSKNYYFEYHFCDIKKENIKVCFDYCVKSNNYDKKIINFGICNFCKTLYYHEDYEN